VAYLAQPVKERRGLVVVYSSGGGIKEGKMSTMLVLLMLEIIILGGFAGYLQLRYAQANYPVSSRWHWALFISGFIPVATGLATLLYYEASSLGKIFLVSIVAGIVSGLFSRFLSPFQKQYIYPKRTDRTE
jgi:hypothetical protein